MTNIEKILKFYTSEGFRDLDFINSLFHKDFEFEWNSSTGFFHYKKQDLINFFQDLSKNYVSDEIVIKSIIDAKENITIRYDYYAATIENPSNSNFIAHFVAIWEFKEDQIIKGYQISVVDKE